MVCYHITILPWTARSKSQRNLTPTYLSGELSLRKHGAPPVIRNPMRFLFDYLKDIFQWVRRFVRTVNLVSCMRSLCNYVIYLVVLSVA